MTSLFPGCGPDCSRDKQIALLKTAMDNATPEHAKQARTDYYTAVYGQDWLQKEKEKVAKDQVEPTLTSYRDQYDEYSNQVKSQSQFSSLASAIKSDGGTPYLVKDYEALKSKADVNNRLSILSGPSITQVPWLEIFLYLFIGISALGVAILLYRKYQKYTASQSVFSGGNRLRKN